MNKLSHFLFIFLISHVCQALATPLLNVSGLTKNVFSGENIPGVSFYAVLNNRRQLLCTGDAQGRFKFEFPVESKSLIIEKDGFRTVSAYVSSISSENLNTSQVFYVRFPLIPLDKQAKDTPYMQSEQKQYILNGAVKENKEIFRTFLITDAISGKPVKEGLICFEYTRDGKKECKEFGEKQTSANLQMKFAQADIVGFNVEAKNYQTYTGNMILEKMDNSQENYEVRLSPEITMLSVNIQGSASSLICKMRNEEGKETVLTSLAKNSFSSLLNEGTYNLNISNSKGALVHAGKVTLRRGLNFQSIIANQDTEVHKPKIEAAETTLPGSLLRLDSLQIITIHFIQTKFAWHPDETHKLDELASFLRTNSQKKVRIVGHTDNVGDAKKNIVLSEYRARVIREYLLNKKVKEGQIFWSGAGSRYPAAENNTEENKKVNRRVEITMLP